MTPMLLHRPDLRITGIDWRTVDQRPPSATIVQGDVLAHDFPAESFDAVVGISSIEHIGLGHYAKDPLDPDGDTHCMQRVVRWLKPGGSVYADVPYGRRYAVAGTSHRVYDEPALTSRLLVPSLREQHRWYGSGYTRTLRDTPDWEARGLVYVALVATKERAHV